MEIRFLSDCPIYNRPAGVPRAYAKERDVVNSLSVAKHGWIKIPGGWVNSYWPSVQIMREIPKETPQTPDQADDAPVQPTSQSEEMSLSEAIHIMSQDPGNVTWDNFEKACKIAVKAMEELWDIRNKVVITDEV